MVGVAPAKYICEVEVAILLLAWLYVVGEQRFVIEVHSMKRNLRLGSFSPLHCRNIAE